MKLSLLLLLAPLTSMAAESPTSKATPPPLSEKEKALGKAGLETLHADDKAKKKKPIPKRLLDKMQSSVPTEPETKNKK